GATPGGPGGPAFAVMRVSATLTLIDAAGQPLPDQRAALALAAPGAVQGGAAGRSGAGQAEDGCVEAPAAPAGQAGLEGCCDVGLNAPCPLQLDCGGAG
ncbi:hypothetical protein KKF91_00750, partial [Myxococcota bacterium]|nr:hypothetical protein [Myxococcota bacterium]